MLTDRPAYAGGGLSVYTKFCTPSCHIVETGNESWRFKHSSAAPKTVQKRRPRTALPEVIEKGETNAPTVDLSTDA